MSATAIVIVLLALAGAVASWVVAAIHGYRALVAIDGPDRARRRWLAIAAWPFTATRLPPTAAGHASVLNKAIVAFLVCMTVAVATISLSTNFNRFSQ